MLAFGEDWIPLLEDQVEAHELGDSCVPRGTARVREAVEVQDAVTERYAHDGSSCQLGLDAGAERTCRSVRIDTPLVAVAGNAESERHVRLGVTTRHQVVTAFGARLLEDRQSEQLVRILLRERVGAPDVERTGSAPTRANRDATAGAEDAWHRGVVADRARGAEDLRGERNAVLQVHDVRRWRRCALEVLQRA